MDRASLTLSISISALAFALAAAGCKDDPPSGGGFPPSAGAGAGGFSGGGAGAAGGAGLGGAGGAAGTMAGPVANMPDAMCAMRAGTTNVPCSNCACTPNASVPGGCLTELMACQSNPDMMFSTLCGAIIDCARMNHCSGTACTGPCMTQISAAVSYMMAAPLTAAQAVGTCTDMKCRGVCP